MSMSIKETEHAKSSKPANESDIAVTDLCYALESSDLKELTDL